MHSEHHRWFSPRLQSQLGVRVYGHWGAPLLAFPTSGGDEWEFEHRGMVAALADLIDAGRVKLVTVAANSGESFYNRGAHPLHRSYQQAQYDAYIRFEVVPFIRDHCRSEDIGLSTVGMLLGAYHAVNTLFKHPDVFRRCYRISGVYDMRRFMDGVYDDNVYFNNPVDYVANMDDPALRSQLDECEIRLVTGRGPWEDSSSTYRLSEILSRKGIRHALDDWGPDGGHDWPFWQRQLREYLSRW